MYSLGDHVDKLLPIYGSTATEEPVIVLLQFCRAKIFDNGDVHISSSFHATKVWKNQKLPHFEEFMKGLDSRSRLSVFRANCRKPYGDIDVISISEIYNRKENLTTKKGMMYYSKCDRSWHEGTVKYRVMVRVMDSTGDAPMLIWDRECYDLVGVSASSLREKPNGWVPPELQSVSGKPILFRIAMKKEQVDSLLSAFVVLGIYWFGLDDFADFEMIGFDEGGSSGSVVVTPKRSLMDEFQSGGRSKRIKGSVVKVEKI
nr:replication protein A 70 kDa DNA-binding subunit B-like [Ipomoea batatas]